MARTPLFARLAQRLCRVETSAHALTRRELLASAAALSACTVEPEPAVEPEVAETHRIAVIGAGLAGLTCAFFLKKAGVPFTLYEGGTEAGGRVHTLRNSLPDGMFVELGGEFIDAHHAAMRLLASELEVALDPYVVDAERTHYWVGGQRVSMADVFASLEAVRPQLLEALETADRSEQSILALDATPLSRWLEEQVPAAEHPELSALFQAAFRAEFGVDPDRQSGINLFHLLGEAGTPAMPVGMRPALRAREGNELFVRKLLAELRALMTVDSRLRAVRRTNTGYDLSFENQRGIGSSAQAERLVLALPFRALDRVDLSNAGLTGEKRALIRELQYGNHTKLAAALGPGPVEPPRCATGDVPFQLAWDSATGESGMYAAISNLVAGGVDPTVSSTADSYVRRILPQLETSFERTLPYVAGSARRLHWSGAPLFLGSVASPRWGQWRHQVTAGRPEYYVHFCGEHTSIDFRGTLEGAAESGALTAAQILAERGIPLPEPLERLVSLKLTQPQPWMRGWDARLPRPLARRREVLEAHAAFVNTLL